MRLCAYTSYKPNSSKAIGNRTAITSQLIIIPTDALPASLADAEIAAGDCLRRAGEETPAPGGPTGALERVSTGERTRGVGQQREP
jgi:hypothetical protein